MSTPIKPSTLAGLNGVNSANPQSGSATLQDLMSRLGAQGAGQGSQQAFSQWLNQHAAAHDEPSAKAKPASPARPAAPPRQAQAAPNPASTRLSTEQLQAMQSQARLAQQAQQAHRPDKVAPKAQAKPATKEGAPRADEAHPDDRADEAAQADAASAPAGDGAAVVRELTPPAHVQANDTAGMMAWLAQLSQADALQGQEGGSALDATSGGSLPGQGEQMGDGANRPGLAASDPGQLSAPIALDSPAWRSASGSASLQADAMLAPVGASGEGRADTAAFANLLTGGLQGAGAGAGAQRSGEASALRHERATLETPFGGTDFAQALAEKVSLWVSTAPTDGPMTAELHLNPAEMGPINVKISLDGQSAQVDFAAAALETRQAIEASMPLLSTALDSIGLSLSGSDVSSQTPQQQSFAQQMAGEAERAQGKAGRERGDSDAQPLDTGMRQVSAPRPGRLGGLDLYA